MKKAVAYDSIGSGYGQVRREDPEIAARVAAGLGDAASVVNVGAGAGSYEPRDRRVLAAEPSQLMIDQRPAGAAPAVRATAESLPLDDAAVDAAMAVNTVHHWPDLDAGLAEMRRVAAKRVVVVTFDPWVVSSIWITRDYFPAGREVQRRMFPPVEDLVARLPGSSVEVVPVSQRCSDEFTVAHWARPERLVQHVRRRASSLWHLIDDESVAEGLARLEGDLEDGSWDERQGHLRSLPELDVGLRLIVAKLG